MAAIIKSNILNTKNTNTGDYEPLKTLIGDSAYDIALKNGYEGSESDWNNESSEVAKYADRAGTADLADTIQVDSAVGSEIQPVYVDSNGKPVPIDFVLGNSCELDATDDYTTLTRTIATTVALEGAIRTLQDATGEIYNKAIVPNMNGTLTYNGSAQSPSWLNLDKNLVNIYGDTSAIDAGTYTTVFVPISPYMWTDGTNEPVNIDWTINKAKGTLSVDVDKILITDNKLSDAVFINKNSEGKISIANSNPNAISTILTGNNLIVSGDGSTNGTALLTISVAEDDNYTAPASVTVEVTASYVKIVSWAEGSEEDIIAMLNAHYNGIIDVSDYWAEGDVKTVSLGAIASGTTDESQERQEIDLLIIGFNHDTLETPINDQTNSAITVQVKNCLNNIGYINKSYNILSCSLWSEAQRRTWCNSDFLEALPNYIISLIKPVTKVTNRGCHYDRAGYEDYRSQYTTTDKVFLLSDSEIFGSGNYLSKNASLYGELPSDGSQYKYMKTQSNRVKSIDKTDTSWWSRTGFINSYGYANYVSSNTTGSCVELYANKSVGLSPAFCL